MALKQTQPKPGHLRGTDSNPTNRTGRSDGTNLGQKKAGHGATYTKDSNPTDRKRPTAEAVGVRGYPRNDIDGGGPKTRRAIDGTSGFNRVSP